MLDSDLTAQEVLAGMRDWRAAHPQATLHEIEAALDERLARLRVALLPHVPAPAVQRGIDSWVTHAPWGFFQLLPTDAGGGVVGLALFYARECIVGVQLGPEGQRWLAGMYQAAATLAAAGAQVVMDDVLFDPEVLRRAVTILAPYRPLLVGVRCALPVAEARERARGDRPVGLARTLAPWCTRQAAMIWKSIPPRPALQAGPRRSRPSWWAVTPAPRSPAWRPAIPPTPPGARSLRAPRGPLLEPPAPGNKAGRPADPASAGPGRAARCGAPTRVGVRMGPRGDRGRTGIDRAAALRTGAG